MCKVVNCGLFSYQKSETEWHETKSNIIRGLSDYLSRDYFVLSGVCIYQVHHTAKLVESGDPPSLLWTLEVSWVSRTHWRFGGRGRVGPWSPLAKIFSLAWQNMRGLVHAICFKNIF